MMRYRRASNQTALAILFATQVSEKINLAVDWRKVAARGGWRFKRRSLLFRWPEHRRWHGEAATLYRLMFVAKCLPQAALVELTHVLRRVSEVVNATGEL